MTLARQWSSSEAGEVEGRQMDCLQTGDPLFTLGLRTCFSNKGQLTLPESGEEAQQTSCLLLLLGLCSGGDTSLHFCSVCSPLMAKDLKASWWIPWCHRLWWLVPEGALCWQTCEASSLRSRHAHHYPALGWGLSQLLLQLWLRVFIPLFPYISKGMYLCHGGWEKGLQLNLTKQGNEGKFVSLHRS